MRRLRPILFLLCVLIVYMAIFAKRGLLDWQRMIRQNHQLVAKIDSTKVAIEDLNQQIEGLRKKPEQQELVVRRVLGYVRSDETVIEFEP